MSENERSITSSFKSTFLRPLKCFRKKSTVTNLFVVDDQDETSSCDYASQSSQCWPHHRGEHQFVEDNDGDDVSSSCSEYMSSLSSLDSLNIEDLERIRYTEIDFDSSFSASEMLQGKSDKRNVNTTSSAVSSDFDSSYSISQVCLGKGGFAQVYQCQSLKSGCTLVESTTCARGEDSQQASKSNPSLAVKIIPHDHAYNQEEIEALRLLKECPHVVSALDVFHEHSSTYVVMEEMSGGDLLSRIARKEVYTEDEARKVMKILFEAVQFCHQKGLAHRDIKPENILLQSWQDDTTVRLADFGMACIYKGEEDMEGIDEEIQRAQMYERCGTPLYAAPEVFGKRVNDNNCYDERVDHWSLGVVLYVLLGGYGPFDGETEEEIIRAASTGHFKFHKKYWKHISQDAKDLITGLLQVNPEDRITLDEALNSPWMTNQSKK